MRYKVRINNQYILYDDKEQLVKDLLPYIKARQFYKGMPRKERNMINLANSPKMNYLIFSHYYTAKDIMKVLGGELL